MFLTSVYEYINSNMYAIIEENEALIIDPHKNVELTEKLHSRGVQKVTILLSHEHHDHTTGVYWYQERFASTMICQQEAAAYIARKQYLRPTLIAFVLGEDAINGTRKYSKFKKDFVPKQYKADITFGKEYSLQWGKHYFQFYHISGHSPGSCLIVMDGMYVFSGDSLLKDLPIIIRFPGSSKEEYTKTTLPLLNKLLKSEMTILPGHGEPFKLKDIQENSKIYVQFR